MAVTEYIFDGKLKWAQVYRPDKKYNDYRLQFYPKDAETRRAVKATGTMCGIKEDKEGELYYSFKSEIQPTVTDGEGRPLTALIGNNSEASVRITVEKFSSSKHGDIARTKLVGVAVTKLIEYKKPEDKPAEVTQTDLPA